MFSGHIRLHNDVTIPAYRHRTPECHTYLYKSKSLTLK